MTLSKPSAPKKPVKCYFSESEKSKINEIATAENKSISSYIRETVLYSRPKKGKTVYSDAVEAACRSYSGISRTHMEAIVSAVIVSLHESTNPKD
tara:strand:+ start:1581 stop:1865 length:285 start_codon:yes stop_codon:yes gene_type:complete